MTDVSGINNQQSAPPTDTSGGGDAERFNQAISNAGKTSADGGVSDQMLNKYAVKAGVLFGQMVIMPMIRNSTKG
ncbi:hypothetical protein [Salinisphaera sp.]|uniref:hypothetical protein n=1 Tax=Salinisphaera sp. TaxID=1914330 RepID=UPI002D793474|nr:hypothetical protein [Salinisphaera sp.]HET7314017.1 hypothetical protein [Salinisphaera sp.]